LAFGFGFGVSFGVGVSFVGSDFETVSCCFRAVQALRVMVRTGTRDVVSGDLHVGLFLCEMSLVLIFIRR